MRVIYVLFFALLLILVPTARAAEPTGPKIDPAPAALVIRGFQDAQTTTFSGNLRLAVTGGPANELTLLASDLTMKDDANIIIDRSNISIPDGISFADGQTRDVRVTVSNVTRPGEYNGELQLLLPGQTLADAVKVPMELHILARPKVQPVETTMTFQVMHPQLPGDEQLASWLMPSSIRDSWSLNLDNQTLAPTQVVLGTVVLRGQVSGTSNPVDAVVVTTPMTLRANHVTPMTLTIKRNLLAPDTYQGVVRLNLEHSDTPVTINAALNVRGGPLLPMLLILFGILFGRGIRSMDTPQARKQIALLPRWYALQGQAADLDHQESRDEVSNELQRIKQRIDASAPTEEAVAAELATLEQQIRAFLSLESLAGRVALLEDAVLKQKLKPQLDNYWQAIRAKDLQRAADLRGQIEEDITTAAAPRDARMGSGTKGGLESFFRMPSGLRLPQRMSVPDRTSARPSFRQNPGRWLKDILAKLLALLAGTRTIPSEWRYWLVRPLLFLLLLLLLAGIGFRTLYLDAGPAFGAKGLADYLGLFLWGLSADIAQRTLQNLPGLAPAQPSA